MLHLKYNIRSVQISLTIFIVEENNKTRFIESRITTHGQKGGASRGCKENFKSN